jgi:hypothetical protein
LQQADYCSVDRERGRDIGSGHNSPLNEKRSPALN